MSKSRPKESKPSVPGYIVTFSDMITLLLTFFVMLLSMAETQVENHKFMRGINSFRTAIADFGLAGFLIDQDNGPEFEHPKTQYRVEENQDKENDRSIDAESEMLKRVMMDIERMMKITPSHIAGMNKTIFQPGNLFSEKGDKLDQKAQNSLVQLSEQIKINYSSQEPIIYVIGLAAEAQTEQMQWMLSAQRAMSIANFLHSQFTDGSSWPVYSWGSGNGGEWIGQDSQITAETQVAIVVLTEK